MKRIGLSINLLSSFLFLGILFVFGLKPTTTEAAVINVRLENYASKEIIVNLEDYIVFSNDTKDYTFTYYCNENGDTVFSFGNGKFWAAKAGVATVIISGKDKNGVDSFIADYKVTIRSEKSLPKIISPNQPSIPKTEEKSEEPRSQTVDMAKVNISRTELIEKRVVIKSRDKRKSSFILDVESEVPLVEKQNATLSFKSLNPNLVYVINLKTKLYIAIEGVGRDSLIVTINGKDFVFMVDITEESLSETTVVLAPGDTYQFTLNGVTDFPVLWKSDKEDTVSIEQSGLVKALKEGHSVITVTAGEKRFAAVVSVTSELKRNAANYTKSYSSKNRYSQPKRMLEGYYDCSSLVWRAYKKYGHEIILTNYAPVAAAMGYYYTNQKKLIKGGITEENINAMVFEPGDLLFVEGKENNRRYKNINHVEMIYGYSIEGFREDGTPILGIRYANNHQVNFKGFVGRPNTDESELSVNRF